jgi:hypothetical protein
VGTSSLVLNNATASTSVATAVLIATVRRSGQRLFTREL